MSQPMSLTQWYARRAASAPRTSPAFLPAARPAWLVSAPTSAPSIAPDPTTLGSARAGATWRWAEPAAPSCIEPRDVPQADRTELPMARDLLRAMARAAAEAGRSEAAVWAEAARLWLAARHPEDDPRPPTPGASASRPHAAESTRERCWSAIDVVLRDLRAPLPRVA